MYKRKGIYSIFSPSTTDSIDYTLSTRSVTVTAGHPQAFELSISVDSVGLEGNETLELTLEPTTTMASNEFLLDKLTVIIQDSDGTCSCIVNVILCVTNMNSWLVAPL